MLTAQAVAQWMPPSGEIVLCAVSGGLDSMTLLHMLHHWQLAHSGQVIAAHYNHHLRHYANRDEDFVRNWCKEQNITFISGGGDVREYATREGLSIEEAARKMRYAFLRQAAAERQISHIYTAHHAGDNAETVLLNLIRGTGIRGLAGMRHNNKNIFRPLLDIPRSDLEEYAAFYKIPHVEDETNADADAAARNLIRLKVMPLLQELNSKAEEHICAAAKQMSIIYDSLDAEAHRRIAHIEVQNNCVTLSKKELEDAPESVRPLMLLCLIDKLGIGQKDFGNIHLKAILHLMRDRQERYLNLPSDVMAYTHNKHLTLCIRPPKPLEVELLEDSPLCWGAYMITLSNNPPELTLADNPSGLVLRIKEKSERITIAPCPPKGRLNLSESTGSRTIKRLCMDRHIPLVDREMLPAIYVDGQLAAVWSIGVDLAFSAQEPPYRFIQIKALNE